MRTRLAISLAIAAGTAAAVVPASAAGPKPQIVDPAGDANAINGQLTTGTVESQSSPVDAAGADIRSVTLRTTYKPGTRTPTGFTVTMALSDAPMPNVVYQVTATAATCSGLVRFRYEPVLGGSADCSGTVTTTTYKGATEKASGSRIVWTIPVSKALPVGTPFSDLAAESRVRAGAVLVPILDEASTDKYFSIG